MGRWTASRTTVYNLGYHFIWCPKYRRPVLVDEISLRLEELIFEKTNRLELEIGQLEIMPDHVHVFLKSKPEYAPHYIMQQIKGYTSKILRQEFKTLRSRLPSLWTRSYYCESIGHISENTIKKYIEDQKKH